MKHCLIFIFLIPYFGITQSNSGSNGLSLLTGKDWLIMKSLNLKDSNDIVYDRSSKIKKWNMDSTRIYSLGKEQIVLMDGEGDIELGKVDSISENHFIVNVTYSGGIKCINEYSDIRFLNNKLSYVFRKWYLSPYTKKRRLHLGYTAMCEKSKRKLQKLNLAQIDKMKKGNKINFEFTNESNVPISNKEVKIAIHLKDEWVMTSVYTDSLGKATSYFPNNYFSTNEYITMLFQCEDLKSSAVLEQKYCPATLKRALTDKKDGTEKIGVMRDN